MKTLLCLLVLLGVAWGQMFCPICQEQGRKSTVRRGTGVTTLMGYGSGYYDEEGRFHPPHNPNYTTWEWSCSNGHKWATREGGGQSGEPFALDSLPPPPVYHEDTSLPPMRLVIVDSATCSVFNVMPELEPARIRMGKNIWTRIRWIFTGWLE